MTLKRVQLKGDLPRRPQVDAGGVTWVIESGDVGNIGVTDEVRLFTLSVQQGGVGNINLGRVDTANISVPIGTINTVRASEWLDGEIEAQAIRRSFVIPGRRQDDIRGDFGGGLRLTDASATLRRLSIAGLVDDATLRTAGGLGNVRLGAIRGSDVFAGVAEGVEDRLPDATEIGAGQIRNLRVNGKPASFPELAGFLYVDSNVAAGTLRNQAVAEVDRGAAADEFGVAGQSVNRYRRLTTGAPNVVLRNLAAPQDVGDHDAPELGDYALRIVGGVVG